MAHTTIAEMGRRNARPGIAALEDAALIDRVAGRDRAAFETLYRGYYPRLRRFLEHITPRRPHLVDEILDDTMLVVWRKASCYNLRSKVSTWIFGIALRRAWKALKRVDDPLEFDADQRSDESFPSPEGALAAHELRAGVAKAIESLSPAHRAVIELTYFEGCSCAEIAQIMRCPVNTVKTRMFHARRKLRRLLAEPVRSER